MTQEPAKYSFYRLHLEVSGNTSKRVGMWKLCTDYDLGGTDLIKTSSLTASSTDPSFPIANIADENLSTEWSSISSTNLEWLQCELTEPQSVKSLYLHRGTSGTATPVGYTLLASNNGVDWNTIKQTTGLSKPLDHKTDLNLYVGGVSKLVDGSPCRTVRISNFDTGEHIIDITPEISGNWEYYPESYLTSMLLTHIGPAGYRPVSDGPIYASILY